MRKPSEVNIAAALEYTRQRQRIEAEAARPRLPAEDIADCMTSGLSGVALSAALHNHFPTANRADVYLAAGLAVAVMQADLTLARMELDMIRRGVAA